MAWDFETEPEFEEQLVWMRAFIDCELVPLEPIFDRLPAEEWRVVQRYLQDRVKAQGLWGAFLDPKLGGLGFGQLKLALMSEIIGRCMMSMTIFGVQAPDSGNMELLAHGATDAQKDRWLWPNLRGDISSAFALTEPFFAGADPTVIGTTAIKDGDEWVIEGRKWFITNASVADIVLVFAETNPEGRPHRHASVFVVPAGTPGMEVVRDIGTMAHPDVEYGRPGNHAEIVFRNCRVPSDHLIGQPGEGFVLAQQRLGGGRIHHAMRWLGQGRRAFDMLCERALTRVTQGSVLAEKQTIQNWIADSWAQMQAARLMTLHAAWVIDQKGTSEARVEIAAIKYFGVQVLHDVIDRAMQAHGSLGMSNDLPLETMYRHARVARIVDGPDEVHRVTVARRVLKGYKPHDGLWPREHIPTRREAARQKFASLLDEATSDL